jgi:hypothetical protein
VGGEPVGFQVVDIAAPIPKNRTDETDIPDNMQIAGYAIVLGRAREIADRKVVITAQLAHRVQRLIDVADEVSDEFERVSPLRGG